MLQVWNVSPDRRHLHAGAARHLPGPLGDPRVDPRLRRLDGRRAAAGADRGGRDRLGRADRLAARRPALRAPDRVAGLARVGLPGQQPAAGRARGGDLLGHLLPADLGGGDRRALLAGRAVVRPLHDAARDRARAVHRDRAAARLAPGERAAALWRLVRGPLAAAVVATVAVAALTDALSEPAALVLFAFAVFALAALAAGVLARGVGAAGADGRRPARRRWSRSRPATGAATAATSSTPGSRCC